MQGLSLIGTKSHYNNWSKTFSKIVFNDHRLLTKKVTKHGVKTKKSFQVSGTLNGLRLSKAFLNALKSVYFRFIILSMVQFTHIALTFHLPHLYV